MHVSRAGVDGGYAWLVLAACITVNILTFGVSYCTGIFYVIFLDHWTYESQSMVALALTLNPGVFFIIGEHFPLVHTVSV